MSTIEKDYQIFRNVCPSNCYDTCSILTYVKDGKIEFIEGAQDSTFTNGGLCVKGYSYVRRVYSKDRVKYPMRQKKRGSGNWERISWDNALTTIAHKIKELDDKDGSLHGLCLATGSGNQGITNYSPAGMMSSLGYTTRTIGTPCWPAGIDAQTFDMGDMWCNDPEDMEKSRYIILWGVNPSACSIHSMKYIYKARENGAKVVVIDPVFTQTASKSDLYFQIKPGTDGALALGMAKYIIDNKLYDIGFLSEHTIGFKYFKKYLDNNVSIEWASCETNIPEKHIINLAKNYAAIKPSTIWVGYGMQRHTNGGANVRAIDALGALCGNIGKDGAGIRYGHLSNRIFNYYSTKMAPPEHAVKNKKGITQNRHINTNKLAQELIDSNNPEIKMLWITCRNPLSQDFNRSLLEKAFKGLDLIVTVDQFFTHTVNLSDIVLPVTSCFEENSINVSYWHYWLGINQKAIEPLYECKSNTQIAIDLSCKMNELYPESCTFPTNLDGDEWINKEFNQDIYDMFQIKSWEDLKKGPVKAKLQNIGWKDYKFKTPSGKYEFFSELANEYGHKPLPEYISKRKNSALFRVLTPHSKFAIHSQFQNIDYMEELSPEPHAAIHPDTALKKKIKNGELVRIFNQIGDLKVKARITANIPKNCILLYEVWFNNNDYCVQNLVDDQSSDMGSFKTGSPGVAIHDQFADLERI